MTPWKQALERQLSEVGAPAALPLTAIERAAHISRGEAVPMQTLYLWINDALERGRLLPVTRGLYLNRFTSPAGRLADAAPFLRRDAVVSLNSALDEAGLYNKSSRRRDRGGAPGYRTGPSSGSGLLRPRKEMSSFERCPDECSKQGRSKIDLIWSEASCIHRLALKKRSLIGCTLPKVLEAR